MAQPSHLSNATHDSGSFNETVTPAISKVVEANADFILVRTGGFVSGAGTTVSVTIDGNAMTAGPEVQNTSGGQNHRFFWLTAADAGWPGAGTFDVIVTAGQSRQQKVSIDTWENVNQANPFASFSANNEDQGAGTSTSSTALSATTNDLLVGASTYFGANRDTNAGSTFQATLEGAGANLTAWFQTGSPTITGNLDFTASANFASFFGILQGTATGTDVVMNPTLGNTDSNTQASQPIDAQINPTLGDTDSNFQVSGPVDVVVNPTLEDTSSDTQVSGVAPGEIFIDLVDANQDPVANEPFDYFITDDWNGSTLQSGQFTTNAQGEHTFTGLSAGTRWLFFRSTSNFFIANGIPFTVT